MGSRYPPEHSNCSLIPHMEFKKSRVFDWSHKDEDPQPGRFFGRFQCSECPNSWGSVWTWSGRGQKCEICSIYNWRSVGYTQPYEVTPLERRRRHKRVRTIHTPIYCEYCVELSRSTKPRKNLEHLCRKAIPGDPWARAYTKPSRYDS